MTARCHMPTWELAYWRRTLEWRDAPPGADDPLHAAYAAAVAEIARECGDPPARLRAAPWAMHERAGIDRLFIFLVRAPAWTTNASTAVTFSGLTGWAGWHTATTNTLTFGLYGTTTSNLGAWA